MSMNARRGRTPALCRVVARGEIGMPFSSVFDEASVARGDGKTVATFKILDESHLNGILDRLRDEGIEILSAEVEPSHRSPG